MKKLFSIVLCAIFALSGWTSPISAAEIQAFNLTSTSFASLGTWVLNDTYLQGRSSKVPGSPTQDATAAIEITQPGTYRLWVRDRDFASDQQGTRTFHVAVDGTRLGYKFGAHGQEGFRWSDAGTLTLSTGEHTIALQDTSSFFARCEGVFLTNDLTFTPYDNIKQLNAQFPPVSALAKIPSAVFPAWANGAMTDKNTISIENNSVKLMFYQGQGSNGPLVQNEIYIKDSGNWVRVKSRSEELGFLLLSALDSAYAGDPAGISISAGPEGNALKNVQTVSLNGESITAITDKYYWSGFPLWFIPSGMEKTGQNQITLTFPSNDTADLKATFSLDDLTEDPKVTLDAVFHKKGAYSFILSSGAGIVEDQYETVTAPLLFVKKAVPSYDLVFAEPYLFTPMATFTLPETNSIVPGKKLTTGVVYDPTCVPQDFAYLTTSRFGMMLRTPENKLRGQFAAPLFGTDGCHFESGQDYSVSYRIINRAEPWFDTYKHISEDIYNLSDLRTNYFHSINEAIYNATDLMLDDDYGGWDPKDMAHYNMEAESVTSMSNAMEAVQRYLLTEDETIMENRAIPTLAFLMSRGSAHFKRVKGNNSYTAITPSPIGSPVSWYNTSVYAGLYQMSQGRMPFLLERGAGQVNSGANVTGITAQNTMYQLTGDPDYLSQVIKLADGYLKTLHSAGYQNTAFPNGCFVFGEYLPPVTAFLAAYEATNEQKYLDAAEEAGRILVTGLWTTGYQNDYAANQYTVIPEETAKRYMHADQKKANWWWWGDKQWRLGNDFGGILPPQEFSNTPLEEETAPGWLPAKAGLGTEHPPTASHSNYIYMNSWAGMLVKLSEYTGDPYFEMQARNAMVGRFGNYAGYYQDRYIFHQMREDYPYQGPDYTLIYWHHIPVFISILEDYLINSIWAKSNRNIQFPSVYQSGYAYFLSNQYGFAPGRFYDEEDMWLQLARGVIEPDSVEIDYLTAKKDGVLGIALINEGNTAKTTTVTLGEKVPGSDGLHCTGTLYDANGNKSSIEVNNGRFTVTIPAKGIQSVVLKIDGIKKPVYVNDGYAYSTELGQTVAENHRGKAYAMQLSPQNYYAYVYVTDQADTTKKLTINYEIGGQAGTKEITEYPFEAIIKVDDVSQPFTYSLTVTKTNGTAESLGGGTLSPMTNGTDVPQLGAPPVITDLFDPFLTRVTGSGQGNGMLRFVVPVSSIPFQVSENSLTGLKIKAVMTNKTDGSTVTLKSIITGNEMRNNETVIKVKPTVQAPMANYYETHSIAMAILNYRELPDAVTLPEEAGTFSVTGITPTGMGVGTGGLRFVIPTAGLPFTAMENGLKGLKIRGTLTAPGGAHYILDSVVTGNEMRGRDQTVLLVAPTTAVQSADYRYTGSLTLSSAATQAAPEAILETNTSPSILSYNLTSFTPNPSADTLLYCALFDGNRLTGLHCYPLTSAQQQFSGQFTALPPDQSNLKLKLFFWKDGTLSPLAIQGDITLQ